MKIGFAPTLRLEDSEGPWCRNVEFALSTPKGQWLPQISRLRISPTPTIPTMQVFNLTTGGLYLHVLPISSANKWPWSAPTRCS